MKRTLVLLWLLLLAAALAYWLHPRRALRPVKVGILHSLTGTMAMSEKPVIDATLFAIEELNRNGGVLGHAIVPVVADGGSDPARFAAEARRLIEQEGVAAIFGCWTSASRKEVKPVVEASGNLLVYPLQYEGVEESANIVYTGSVPNQQIKPAVKWSLDHLGNRFYLLGSDYIFPRLANRLIRDMAGYLGGEILAERYAAMGSDDFSTVAGEIDRLRPSVVFNTLNGSANLAFFAALKARHLTAAQVPVFSFSLAETEVQALIARLGNETMTGHYASWAYFQTLAGDANRAFVARFRKRFGADTPITDPMVSAYMGVRLWSQAATEAASFDPVAVHRHFARQSGYGPGGIVYIDDDNFHAWKPVRIGRINAQGQFEVVWDSHKPIRPEPYPNQEDKERWQNLERRLHEQWGGRWENAAGGPR